MPKAKKVTKKKVSTKRAVRRTAVAAARPTPSTKSSSMKSSTWLVLIVLGLLAIAGVSAYSKRQTPTPVQVMEVGNPSEKIAVYDTFGDGKIDKGDWNVGRGDGVTVAENKNDLLRMDLPAGDKARAAFVAYKKAIPHDSDFKASVVLSKPIVTGEGVGRSGIRFTASESEEPDGAVLQWVVSGTRSELVFSVAANGKSREVKRVAVTGNKAHLVIRRIEDEYQAFYRMNNFDDDNQLIEIGEGVEASNLGGKIRVFTNSSPEKGKAPKVVGRFDVASIQADLANKVTAASFRLPGTLKDSDNFNVVTTGKAAEPEKRNGNLIMRLPAAADAKERSSVRVVAKNTIPNDRRGASTVELFKPQVNGEGQGNVGLTYVSDGEKNDESASVRWVVSGDTSRLIFVVADGSGKTAERQVVQVPPKVVRMTVKLVHADDKYIAWYRFGAGGDDDQAYKKLGEESAPKLGAKGRFVLFTAQQPAKNGKYPGVTGRFDSFRVTYVQ